MKKKMLCQAAVYRVIFCNFWGTVKAKNLRFRPFAAHRNVNFGPHQHFLIRVTALEFHRDNEKRTRWEVEKQKQKACLPWTFGRNFGTHLNGT